MNGRVGAPGIRPEGGIPCGTVVVGIHHRGTRVAAAYERMALGEVALQASVALLDKMGFPVGPAVDDLGRRCPGLAVVGASLELYSAVQLAFGLVVVGEYTLLVNNL